MQYFFISFCFNIGQEHRHYYERLVKADNVEKAFELIMQKYPNAQELRDITIR